jgi:hypothetical protein
MNKNLRKAKIQWGLLSRPLVKTGVSPRFKGYFYKAVVQSVLLYGSESWTVTQMLAVLRGFHHKIARQISQLLPERINDTTWYYPPIKEALEIAGLFPVEHYIRVRQNTVAAYVAARPILQLCKDAKSSTASYRSQSGQYRWWSQPLQTTTSDQEEETNAPTGKAKRNNYTSTTTAPPQHETDDSTSSHTAQEWSSDDTDSDIDPPLTLMHNRAPTTRLPPWLTTLTLPASISTITSHTPLKTAIIEPLTTEELLIVQEPSEVVISHPSLPRVTLRSVQSLKPGMWLTDEVINCYGQLLNQRDANL